MPTIVGQAPWCGSPIDGSNWVTTEQGASRNGSICSGITGAIRFPRRGGCVSNGQDGWRNRCYRVTCDTGANRIDIGFEHSWGDEARRGIESRLCATKNYSLAHQSLRSGSSACFAWSPCGSATRLNSRTRYKKLFSWSFSAKNASPLRASRIRAGISTEFYCARSGANGGRSSVGGCPANSCPTAPTEELRRMRLLHCATNSGALSQNCASYPTPSARSWECASLENHTRKSESRWRCRSPRHDRICTERCKDSAARTSRNREAALAFELVLASVSARIPDRRKALTCHPGAWTACRQLLSGTTIRFIRQLHRRHSAAIYNRSARRWGFVNPQG